MSETEAEGGRIFFSSKGRTLEGEDEICILSVGVDIGSSTSHLVFSRIVLERMDSRYVVTQRETFYESDILLTPYSKDETIDSDALGAFIAKQYAYAPPVSLGRNAVLLTRDYETNARNIARSQAALAAARLANLLNNALR